MRINFGINI